ncbi:MAG TPA: class I SAM-dependent methyltransferase [Alphaproteobacteria bacterium]|jgi:2-polyprenyl-3-methyl-5-hydroxy-6-metoxy-1,4-benzoquinol methylase
MQQTAAAEWRGEFPSIAEIAMAVLKAWPEHKKFVDSSLSVADDSFLMRLENVADHALTLTGGDLVRFAADYRWMCEVFREEQFYFARHKKYRRSTIEEAIRDVYGNAPYMSRYVNGILISQILWHNHAHAMDIYREQFLPRNKNDYAHLEVGPGHGLFLSFAATDDRCGSVAAWDVSPSSLESTRRALEKMGVIRDVMMTEAEICSVDPAPEQFDSIMCSEVLEHTEQPEKALANIVRALRPGGRLFLNIPVNSPAPDHIYLWRKPEEIRQMVEAGGLEIERFITLPPTGKTLEQALKHDFDISCIAIARKTQ